jgi:hypothetical protein
MAIGWQACRAVTASIYAINHPGKIALGSWQARNAKLGWENPSYAAGVHSVRRKPSTMRASDAIRHYFSH